MFVRYGALGKRWDGTRTVIDHGTEFTSKALEQWAYANQVTLHFITSGWPMENGCIESFHGRFREECLNQHWFLTLDAALETIESWRIDCKRFVPQRAGLLDAGGICKRLCKCGQQHALCTCAQPRLRLRAEYAAKLKHECSHLYGLNERGSSESTSSIGD